MNRSIASIVRVALVVAALALLVVPALGGVASAGVPATDPSPVSDHLMCLCGCNSVLTDCPHTDCGWGIPEKEFIGSELVSGKPADEIIDAYVAKYGEEVLAAPSKSGFNLTAWVMPFAVLLTAGVGVFFLVQGWSRRRLAVETAEAARTELPPEQQRRLEDELKDFD